MTFALIGLVIFVVVYALTVIYLSRTQRPIHKSIPLVDVPSGLKPTVNDVLTISTWNLGYAGLGADSDFIADGGKSLFPPSWSSTRRNLREILKQASKLDSDISLYQEVSDSSPMSFWAPLDAKIRSLHIDRLYLFQRDVATKWLFWPLRIHHGLVVASKIRVTSAETVPLPADPEHIMGLISRLYALQIIRIAETEDGPGWTIIHLHLSAFDNDGLRETQLRMALTVAEKEYEANQRVIMGGDWNLALVEQRPTSPEDAEILFWLRPFPTELLPKGWLIVAPHEMPTVRTDHKPYVAGENPTSIIDGFVISPNVRSLSVSVVDTGFRMSDHQPVIAQFSTLPRAENQSRLR